MTDTTTDPPGTTSITRAEREHPAARVAAEIAAGDALTLSQAARERPAHRGRRAWGSTIWRHITRGVIGPDGVPVRLEAARIGGRWLTSRAALARYMAALTPIFGAPSPPTSPTATRPSAPEKANAEAARLGY